VPPFGGRGPASAPDIVIVGAGVSAMLLARSMIGRGCYRTLRLIGVPEVRAHRFSYWSDGAPTPFDPYTERSWPALRVVERGGRAIPVPLTRFAYHTFVPGRWFDDVVREVRSAPGVVITEARAESWSSTRRGAVVRAEGEDVAADWVFSSARPRGMEPACRQYFEGWEVAVGDRPLDERAATLLDFRTPMAGDFRFVYALPLGRDRLFVEHVSYQPSDHVLHLTDYLNEVVGPERWVVLDRERGATPLYLDPPAREDRIVTIGVAGGLAKVATGYALLRMWRDAEAIARGLQRRGRPERLARTRGLQRLADRFFVDLLRRTPERLPELLGALFRGASGDAVLAFLDDGATKREQMAVARAMPDWLEWFGRRAVSRKAVSSGDPQSAAPVG
jgi:lycopene beta-cyclase